MNYLGTIVAVGGSVGTNNRTTAAPFIIPDNTPGLYLEVDADGLKFELGVDDAFETTLARGTTLLSGICQGPFKTGRHKVVVSVFNPNVGAGNVKVYSAPGS